VISKIGALGLIDMDQIQVYQYQATDPLARLSNRTSQLLISRVIGEVLFDANPDGRLAGLPGTAS
jgi:hypothetical protein